MEHSFDVDVAQQIGVNCAVILKHLLFWIIKNAANEENFRDGMYWTYSSIKAFEEIFPYLTAKQIRSALNKMRDDGIIATGNYNRSAYDRTTWYAITEKGFSILHIDNFHLPKWENGNAEKGEPIPDTNTDIETDNLLDSKESNCQTADAVQRVIDEWNTLSDVGIAPVSRLSKSSKRYISVNARIKQYGEEEVIKTVRIIRDCDFLLGRIKDFMITFDWFVKPTNFEKVHDGNYLNKDKRTAYVAASTPVAVPDEQYADYQ